MIRSYVYWYKKHEWVAEGGKIIKVKNQLPPNGYALEYDKETGVPSKTGTLEQPETYLETMHHLFGLIMVYVLFCANSTWTATAISMSLPITATTQVAGV